MTKTELITRLCEMAAELAELSEKAQDTDVKFGITSLGEDFQKTLRELQGES